MVGLSVLGAIGCSSSSGAGGTGGSGGSAGKSLDCAFLAASDNCWKTTAASAASCLPAETDVGTLSADGKTCTYASGQVVTFATALVLPLPTNGTDNWDFTVTSGTGQPCLAYKNTKTGGIVLTVQGQTVKEGTSGAIGVSLTCPDGTTYSTSNALDLLSCDAGVFGGLPGNAWSDTDTSVSLSLLAVTSTGDTGLPVFNCQTSP